MTTIENAAAEQNFLPFLDPEYRENPYPFYAKLRIEHPVYRHPAGVWAITRYDDIAKLLYDRSLSVAEIDFGPASPLHDSVLGADAPEHTRLRRALSKWFTPKAVQEWTKIAREEIDRRLDQIITSGGAFDAVKDLAFPVTFATISHILGVPVRNALKLRQATYDIGKSLGIEPTTEETASTADAFAWFLDHSESLIAYKQEQPGDGLLDTFLDLEKQGTMTRAETNASVTLLFAVGHLDITFLIVNGIRLMSENPAITDTYRDNPKARASIINEMLRMDTPEQFVTRQTTQPTEVNGVTIPPGEIIILFIGAGNKDPEMFPNPDQFDHTRDASLSKHLAFGSGIHGCAGQVLARAEADAIFTALVTRFRTLKPNGPVEYNHSDFIRAINHLPVLAK